MLYGIVGTGNIGGTLATLLTQHDQDVLLANSRGPETLEPMVKSLGLHACAATVKETIITADVVIEAIPFGALSSLPSEQLRGKILISAANLYPERDGEIDLGGLAQSQWVEDLFPEVHLAKGFNTIFYKHLASQGSPSTPMFQRRALPFASNSSKAAEAIWNLMNLLGFAPLDLGSLANTKGLSQPGDLLYNKELTLSQARQMLLAQQEG